MPQGRRFYTKLVAWLALVLSLAALFPYSARAEQFDLFVMAGQSNMVGFKSAATGYPVAQDIDKTIPFFWIEPGVSSSNGAWTTLRPQAGLFPAGHFGPEVTFARRLVAAKLKPAIFKYSLGSTSLDKNWLGPGAGGMYDEMIRQLKAAIALEQQAGNVLKVRGFVWIQGESDAETAMTAKAYEMRLQQLFEDFRADVVHDATLPVILGVDEQHPWVQQHPQVVQAQMDITTHDRCVAATSMLGLPKADETHLTPAGVIAHGQRLADAYFKLRKQCSH